MTPYRRLLSACWIAAVAGCTPVGLWVYADPGLEVSRVRLQPTETSAPPVVLGLAVLNPNDYDLSTARLELQLRLDHTPIGSFFRDSVFPVPKYGITDLTLPLTPMPAITPERLRTLSRGTRHFEVEGVATFSTPFGPHQVRFAHAGDLVFGGGHEGEAGPSLPADSVRARRGPSIPHFTPVRPMPDGGPTQRARVEAAARREEI
jgi:hypothetical protein